jgi:hypothetical protein
MCRRMGFRQAVRRGAGLKRGLRGRGSAVFCELRICRHTGHGWTAVVQSEEKWLALLLCRECKQFK